ncbi:S8 family serine peptidase [Streptomyces termitum]|uniref:S8 family serine peptidase n=1 Tax=Streptomyces termitum TaxID=67368 RepID=UPI0033BA3603
MIESGRLRRVLLGAVAITALTAGLVGVAPAATAADARSQQWYLDAMGVEKMWQKTTGKGMTIAVIDSGVDPSVPSLKGKVLKGWDASKAEGDETDDYNGHGTSMAEFIVGSGTGGSIQGLAPDAKVIPYRVSNTKLQNEQTVNAFDMEQAIRAAADSDAQIINVSMGSDYYASEVREAVQYAQSKGKLLFAAAGNNAEKGNKPQYPASYPEAIAVAATGRDGKAGAFSQHGEAIDIAAPGEHLPAWCDEKLDRYCDAYGTSIATAIVSGSAALIWSAHPDWTANQVLRVMLETAGRGEDWTPGAVSNYLGHGIVRPGMYLNRGVGKPGDPRVNPLTNAPAGPGAAEANASAKPSATASGSGSSGTAPSASASPQAPADGATSAPAVAGSGESTGTGSRTGLVIGGAAVALVVAAGAAFVIARRRRAA